MLPAHLRALVLAEAVDDGQLARDVERQEHSNPILPCPALTRGNRRRQAHLRARVLAEAVDDGQLARGVERRGHPLPCPALPYPTPGSVSRTSESIGWVSGLQPLKP